MVSSGKNLYPGGFENVCTRYIESQKCLFVIGVLDHLPKPCQLLWLRNHDPPKEKTKHIPEVTYDDSFS